MFIRVAVPVPTLDLLTYVVPPDTPAPVVGARVVVPVGARTLTGIVVETDVGTDAALDRKELKSVQKVLDAGPFLPADVVALARWTGGVLRWWRRSGDHGGASAENARHPRGCAQDSSGGVDHGGRSGVGR